MNMLIWRYLALTLLTVLAISASSTADETRLTAPPEGYDVRREGFEHGKIELIEYDSKTVGIKRKARVYTPPGYSSEKNTPCSICSTVSVEMRTSGIARELPT